MKTFKAWLSCTALFSGSIASACLWLHGTTIDGLIGDFEGYEGGRPEHLAKCITIKPVEEPELFSLHRYQPDNPVAQDNDKAVQQLLLGDAKFAIELLNLIEQQHPGVYFTAANLGTAYELAGDDVQALRWILEGIKRNPDSHMRTEWLHARILDAKLKLKADPSWLDKHTITGADYSQLREKQFFLVTPQREVSGKDIHDSLFRQLYVRMLFVKSKDKIVAQLLKELALAEAQLGVLEQAIAYAKLAEQYGLPKDALENEHSKWVEIIKRGKPGPHYRREFHPDLPATK